MGLGWSADQQEGGGVLARLARVPRLPSPPAAALPLVAFGAAAAATAAVARIRRFPPDTFPARVLSVKHLGDDAVHIVMRVRRGRGGARLAFSPGQWVDLFVLPSLCGGYSICSSPSALPRLELVVQLGDHPCAQYCNRRLAIGHTVRIRSGGEAVLPLRDACGPSPPGAAPPTLVLAAGGIGITPALGVVEALFDEVAGSPYSLPEGGRVVVLYSCRRASDFVALPRLLEIARRQPAGRLRLRLRLYRTAATNPGPLPVTQADVGAGLARLYRRRIDQDDIRAALDGADERDRVWALVCGPSRFMEDVELGLAGEGVPAAHIVSERWW